VPQRAFYSILTSEVVAASRWYVDLFGYQIVFDSDWFVQLQDATNPASELGFIAHDHAIVSDVMRRTPVGGLITLVVDDVDVLHQAAVERGIEVLEQPTDLFYGQRRMLLVDPDGQILDVSSECPPDPDWLASLSA
jgi:uncharacterized glyoxalase superfamily protein PhnB